MDARPLDRALTDGEITLRPPTDGEAEILVAERDAEFRRFLGDGSPAPSPTAVIANAARQVVGWIDCDVERDWLQEGEVNIGYNVFAQHRGQGLATRSLRLLVEHLRAGSDFAAATLLVDPANAASITVGYRAGFERHEDVNGQLFFKLLFADSRHRAVDSDRHDHGLPEHEC